MRSAIPTRTPVGRFRRDERVHRRRSLADPTDGRYVDPGWNSRRITLGASTEARFTYFRPESFPHPWTKPAIIGIDDVVKTMLIHLHQRKCLPRLACGRNP